MVDRLNSAGARLRWAGVVFFLFWVLGAGAQQVILHLHNGDRITGTITLEDTNRVVMKTRWAEALTVPVGAILKREVVSGEAGEAVAPTNVPPPAVTAVPPPAAPEPPAPPPAPPVKPKPPQRWFGDMQVGATLLFSEKEQQLYTGRLKLTYAQGKFRNILDYLFAYGRTDGEVSANRMEGSVKTDFDFYEKFYVYNQGGAGYDQIRLIDTKYDLGPGLGYHALVRPSFTLNLEAGLNYQVQNRADDTRTELLYYRLAEDVTWKLSSRFTMDEKFEFFPEVKHWGEYRFRFESNLRYLLGNNISLVLTVIDQYDTNPAKQVNRNDLQLRSSVGLKF